MQPPLRQAEALEGLAPPAASQALAPGPLTPPSLNEEWASLLGEEVPAPPPPPRPQLGSTKQQNLHSHGRAILGSRISRFLVGMGVHRLILTAIAET